MPRPRPEQPDYVTSQDALAKRLGVDRKTIGNWIRHSDPPGNTADGRYHVAAWQAWMEENGRSGNGGGDDDDGLGGDDGAKVSLQALKAEKEREHIRKLRIANDEAEGLLIPRDEVEIMLMSVWVGLNTFIQTMPGRLMLATRGVSDDIEKQAIYQRQADQMVRIINEFADYLERRGPENITWQIEPLRQLFDSLREPAKQA